MADAAPLGGTKLLAVRGGGGAISINRDGEVVVMPGRSFERSGMNVCNYIKLPLGRDGKKERDTFFFLHPLK